MDPMAKATVPACVERSEKSLLVRAIFTASLLVTILSEGSKGSMDG